MAKGFQSFWQSKTLWMSLVIFLAPLPLPILHPSKITWCGYSVIVTGVFWVSELLPLAVTSLFPIFFFPLFGIMTAKQVCMSYTNDTLMLFLGSLVLAVAVEKWNLHKRLALRTLTLVGPQPRWLLLGIMFPCWFLSMWMSNTATCAMMMPIVTAILMQIKEAMQKSIKCNRTDNDVKINLKDDDGGIPEDERQKMISKQWTNEDEHMFLGLAKTFSLCTAFSANIGGIATLTGTPPNVIFKGLADVLFEKYGGSNPINFANWLVLGVPISLVCLIFLWLWMQLYGQGFRCFHCGRKDNDFQQVRDALKSDYSKLGSITFPEVMVLLNFILLAALWITRKPGFIPGWSFFFREGYPGDSTPAVLIAVLLFILPAKLPRWMSCCRTKVEAVNEVLEGNSGYEPLLTWKMVNERMAWGVLLLMGGGFALAEGCQLSGLSLWFSGHMQALSMFSPWLMSLILTVCVCAVTQVTSNAATTTLFVPIAGELGVKLGINPLYFMIPCAVAASLAFMLPVATPPNAIAFSSGYLKVRDMVLAGLPINIFSVIILLIACNTWAVSFFNLLTLPDIFMVKDTISTMNATMSSNYSLTFPALNNSIIA